MQSFFKKATVFVGTVALVASMSPVAVADTNLVPNPSLEDGGSVPSSWSSSSWGRIRASFIYPVGGYNSSRAAKVTVSSRRSGDAKWYFNEVPITPGAQYQFSDMYQATAGTTVTIQYKLSNGSYSYIWLGDGAPASSWRPFSASFTAPQNAVALTIFHLIAKVGSLTVDNYSLLPQGAEPPPPALGSGEAMVSLVFDDGWTSAYTNAAPLVEAAGFKSTFYVITETYQQEWDGYMFGSQILDLQARGHEIGAHTRTHVDLTKVSSSRLQDEVAGSRQDLLNLGIRSVSTFAYPYGSYNTNIVNAVKSAGFKAARSIIEGLNFKIGLDPYLLKWQGPEITTTLGQMKTWIDEAIAQKGWLVLSFHEINNSGVQYSNSPADLAAVIDYLKTKNVKVVTVAEGFDLINQ